MKRFYIRVSCNQLKMEKKEIKVHKNVLNLILKPIILSIITLFVVQHFGKIGGGYEGLSYDQNSWIVTHNNFRNPINGKIYTDYENEFGIGKKRKETYLKKLKIFYIPSLFGNLNHLIIVTIIYSCLFAFFGSFKFKIIK